MDKLNTEKIMRPIVVNWLQEEGYYVAHEVMLCGYCDLVGCLWAERIGWKIPQMLKIVTVELKIRDINGVLRQAENNCYFADYSYAAIPFQKYVSIKEFIIQKFKEKGVGLLVVKNDYVGVVIPACENKIKHNPNICKRLWNFKIRHRNHKNLKNGI